MPNNIQTYSGKSIAQQLLGDTKLGKWLWGNNTYKDGYRTERKDASFKESANGQLVERMKNTSNNAGQIVVENFADIAADLYQGANALYNKDWQGATMAAANLILPQVAEETIKSIRRAAKASNFDFSRWGWGARSDMKKIPGNSDIVDELSDAELGYILNERSKAIEDIPKDQRIAILHGMESRGNHEISYIDIKDNSGKIGNLRPEYKDVVPGTISIARVDNLSGGLKHGISEDGYNALLIASGKPVSAGNRWLMPEKTSMVYSKYDQDLPDENFTMKADWPIESILSDRELTTNAIKTLGLDNLSVNEAVKELRKTIDQWTNDGLKRFPLTQYRPILVKPTRHIPTKHEFLFKITSDNVKNGKPIVLWNNPDIWLKQGGKLKETK